MWVSVYVVSERDLNAEVEGNGGCIYFHRTGECTNCSSDRDWNELCLGV